MPTSLFQQRIIAAQRQLAILEVRRLSSPDSSPSLDAGASAKHKLLHNPHALVVLINATDADPTGFGTYCASDSILYQPSPKDSAQ